MPIRQRAAFDYHDQGLITVEANHLDDCCTPSVGFDRTGIRDLSTALGVERRLAQLDRQPPLTEVVERTNARADINFVVAQKGGHKAGCACECRHAIKVDAATLAGSAAGALSLTLHQFRKARLIDREILLGRELLRQLEGKTKGVVELEGLGSGDRDAALAADACDAIVEQRRAGF